MLQITDLHYTYPPIRPDWPEQVVLDGISFEVSSGRCLAVTGPNGCGKSTLVLAVAGLAPGLTGGYLSGEVRVAGKNVQTEPPGALADVLGLVLEDPVGQLFNPTVADEIAWGLENLGIDPVEMPARIDRALAAVGLADIPREQPPQTLSGGQQKRLALAAALALEPRVLVLDQPSGGLAPAARTEMIAVLRDLRARHDLTILLAESDPAVIAALADDVLLLEGGHIAAQGAPRVLYPKLDGQHQGGAAIPPAGQFASTVNAAWNGNGHTKLVCLTVDEAVEHVRHLGLEKGEIQIKDFTDLTGEKRGTQWSENSEKPAVQLANLCFAYDPAQPILRDISLTIPRGQFVALTGDNGAGKTTLARHLIGLLRPTTGMVSILGEETAGMKIGQLAKRVGFAFQNPEVQIFNPTVREEVAFGPRNLGLNGQALDTAVEAALGGFGLAHLADYPPAVLSFGVRRLVALAGIAAMNTPIIVLDEPTVGLDTAGQAHVMGWLTECHSEGATILLITHDMELATRHAQRLLVLHKGQIAADGPPRAVFAQPEVLAQAGLEPPFAVQLTTRLGRPDLSADLTPQGTARALLERLNVSTLAR
ncbi:MAG: ATP-binding cassette domain-containing protein [Anaerolineae bacterium]|nr:ATP-binding cassette domain-containing protein [Anaerolineae bacterium]